VPALGGMGFCESQTRTDYAKRFGVRRLCAAFKREGRSSVSSKRPLKI
jgi:hypothetical protein